MNQCDMAAQIDKEGASLMKHFLLSTLPISTLLFFFYHISTPVPGGGVFFVSSPTIHAKVIASGLSWATDKINAVVLASEVAISLLAGLQTKKARKETKNHTLCHKCTKTGVPWLLLFKGLIFCKPLSWGMGVWGVGKTTHLAFPHQIHTAFTAIVCTRCRVTSVWLCPLMMWFGSRAHFLLWFKCRLLGATLGLPHRHRQQCGH